MPAAQGSNAENHMLFVAKVLRSAKEDDVKALFNQFGKVHDVNLFRAFQGAPTTKGCGLVTMASHEDAVAAISALDGRHVWQGMESPMVVKWMDSDLQRRRREQHLAAMRHGLTSLVPCAAAGPDAWVPQSFPPAHIPHQDRMSMAPEVLQEEQESPPAGCTPDAIKLFIGNIPKSCTEEQLLPFFGSVGQVVELVLVRDKAAQESKGSAFVWYATRASAERAILQFNLRHVLPDPSGEQDRPLVVRKAKARAKPALPGGGMLAGLDQGYSMGYPLHMQPVDVQGPLMLHSYYAHMGHNFDGMSMPQPDGTKGLAMVDPGAYRIVQHGGGSQRQAFHTQGGDTIGGYTPPGGNGHLEQSAISIAITPQQMSVVNQHMYSVQAMSGAELNITPGAPGLFHLILKGSKQQVDHARGLLSSILGSSYSS